MNYTKEVLSEPDGSIINKVVALCISFGSAGGKVWRVFWKGTSNQLPRMVGSLSLLGQPKLRSEAGAARDLPPRPVSSPGVCSLSPICAGPSSRVRSPGPAVSEVTTSADFLFLTGKMENLSAWTFSHGPRGSDETTYVKLRNLITYLSQ